MNMGKTGLITIIGLALVVLNLTAFTVNERELAIKLQVGEVVQADYKPGLHFKIPFIQTVEKFSSRILTIDERPERIFTGERLAMDVDFFVKYRIINTVDFYVSTGELVDVRVKQVEFPDDVRNSVYQQMREERGRIAAERRAEGMEVSEQKKSTADKERTIILANANRDSQKLRGTGDAKAAEIYADAYNQDPEFYAFYRSIDAYRNSIGNSNDIMVIDPNNEFFRYLNNSSSSKN